MIVKHIKPRLCFLRQSFIISLFSSTVFTIYVNFLPLQIGLVHINLYCMYIITNLETIYNTIVNRIKLQSLCNGGNLLPRYIVHDPNILPRILKLNSRLVKEWLKL